MSTSYPNLAIVIPSLDPTHILIPYISDLIGQGFAHIYVVNDGSSPSHDPIFQVISELDGCTLLAHDQNRGKGAALKTAFHHISQTFPKCQAIITVDSDGQHAVTDVCRMADCAHEYPGHLILGGRSFSGGNVPIKSLVGNRISSAVFFLLHGVWVQDTQTGLRLFDMNLLPQMCSIPGDRFDYEMAVLTTCVNQKIPLHFIGIDTIYLNGNTGSHFHPLADSALIGRVLLSKLCRFMVSSGLSCLVDISLCWTFLHSFSQVISSNLLRIGLSVVLARTVSLVLNYTLNRRFVFHVTTHPHRRFGRYLLLAMANMVALTGLIYWSSTWVGLDARTATILANAMLFAVNYQVQRSWVFPVMLGGSHESYQTTA